MSKYILIALLSGVISAFSQVILKKGAVLNVKKTGISRYFNIYVIAGYFLVVCCMFMMIIAYRRLPFKYGAILESLVYFYVMIMGKFFFGEKLTLTRVLGNFIIIIGVVIFQL